MSAIPHSFPYKCRSIWTFVSSVCAISHYHTGHKKACEHIVTASGVGIIWKTILPVHLSRYLTNCVEPTKCSSQLVPNLRLSLDLDRVQQTVSLGCVYTWKCIFLCVFWRGYTVRFERWNNYRQVENNGVDLRMCKCHITYFTCGLLVDQSCVFLQKLVSPNLSLQMTAYLFIKIKKNTT